MLTSSVLLRSLRIPDDLSAVAHIRSAAHPHWPISADEVQQRFKERDPALHYTNLVAQHGGQVVGEGAVHHDGFSFEEWRYLSSLNVLPGARGRGVGSALYAELLRRLQQRGAREVQTILSSRPDDAPGRAFLERRGWQVTWERCELSIDTATLDPSALARFLRPAEERGVNLMPIAELAPNPQRDRWLYELDWLLFQDVPMSTAPTKKPFESWVKEEIQDPQMCLQHSYVAVQPGLNDPLTGSYIGYSTLGRNASGFYYIGMTGVRREVRGQGLAKALKAAAMGSLSASGGVIKTFNDSPNAAMLGMNVALGFKHDTKHYRYELHC